MTAARPRWPAVLWRWAPVALYMAGIFIGSAIPGDRVPVPGIWRFDKVVHAVAFAGLAALAYRALGRYWPAVAVASGYGLLDEIHQRFTPKRSADPFDWVADTAGALVGAGVALAIARAVAGRRAMASMSDSRRT